MREKGEISVVGNELAKRAPTMEVLINLRLWWFGVLIVLVAMLLVWPGIHLSLAHTDWGFLSRFGALEVVIGSFLVGRPIWRRRFKSRFVTATITKDGKISDEQFAEYVMERTDVWFFYNRIFHSSCWFSPLGVR